MIKSYCACKGICIRCNLMGKRGDAAWSRAIICSGPNPDIVLNKIECGIL